MIERSMRERYTVTPKQFERVAVLALIALTAIVMTGAAVRLTGSGLGCPDWPRCYGKLLPPLQSHAVIEFANRAISGLVGVTAVAAAVLAWRRRPFRRDLALLGALLPLGVLAQAILGGYTVTGKLDYGYVMAHFALSMLILVAAATLAWQAIYEPGARPRASDRATAWVVRALLALAALTIFAGTAATAAGPHAGGSPGQRINRLNFDGPATMDWVIHRHGEIALAFGLAVLAAWLWLRRRRADPLVRRSLAAVCVLMALQGAVGLIQYETHLPTELVWVHVSLACGIWVAALWATAAAGRLAPRRAAETAERGLAARTRAAA
jgi:cytochrome c oxidase assembly protein subunit 15